MPLPASAATAASFSAAAAENDGGAGGSGGPGAEVVSVVQAPPRHAHRVRAAAVALPEPVQRFGGRWGRSVFYFGADVEGMWARYKEGGVSSVVVVVVLL